MDKDRDHSLDAENIRQNPISLNDEGLYRVVTNRAYLNIERPDMDKLPQLT